MIQVFDAPRIAHPRSFSLAKELLQQYKKKVKQEQNEIALPTWLESMRQYKVYDVLKGYIPLTDLAAFREAVKVRRHAPLGHRGCGPCFWVLREEMQRWLPFPVAMGCEGLHRFLALEVHLSFLQKYT